MRANHDAVDLTRLMMRTITMQLTEIGANFCTDDALGLLTYGTLRLSTYGNKIQLTIIKVIAREQLAAEKARDLLTSLSPTSPSLSLPPPVWPLIKHLTCLPLFPQQVPLLSPSLPPRLAAEKARGLLTAGK